MRPLKISLAQGLARSKCSVNVREGWNPSMSLGALAQRGWWGQAREPGERGWVWISGDLESDSDL